MNERELCYQILYDIHFGGQLSHIAIKKALDECDLKKLEVNKAFVTRLVNGELEKHLTIMFLLTRQAKRPEGKIKPVLRIIMAEALYQAIYMSVPTSAAVNEAVKLAKKHRFVNLSGFVNGVLRQCIAGYEQFLEANPEQGINDYVLSILEKEYLDKSESFKLSVLYSCPEWLVNHFLEFMTQAELEEMLSINPESSDISVYRLESSSSKEEFLESLASDGLEYEEFKGIYRIKNAGDPKKLSFFTKGLGIVQDASSSREADFIPELHAARVLDICAAPGGKAIHCADKLSKLNGTVLACDISVKKVNLINDTIKRVGLTNIETKVNDATEYNASFKEAFDIVLADLPCSGLGVLFKKPDIKYKTTTDDIEELAFIQRSIIDNLIKYVKKGGYIVYSTCTLTRLENEGNARYLVKKGFELLKEETIIPTAKQDGFYIALLQRK